MTSGPSTGSPLTSGPSTDSPVTGSGIRSGTGAPADLFFEDLSPGRTFELGVTTVDEAEMVAFAERFDPQWYHLDPELARQSHYGGMIASGFFTVSLFMRAYVDHVLSRAAADASPDWRNCAGSPRSGPVTGWPPDSTWSAANTPPPDPDSARSP